MKYRVITPLARTERTFAIGDLVEINDKDEAERLINAHIVIPLRIDREIHFETADFQPVGLEKNRQSR